MTLANRPTVGLQDWQTRAVGGVREAGLKLVRPVRSRARRAPFVVVVLTVLGIGLVGLIVISTLQQSLSFEQSKLDREVASLEHDRDALRRDVDQLSSPASIAARAGALGMVRNQNPAFLRLSDGAVLGKPEPAIKGQR